MLTVKEVLGQDKELYYIAHDIFIGKKPITKEELSAVFYDGTPLAYILACWGCLPEKYRTDTDVLALKNPTGVTVGTVLSREKMAHYEPKGISKPTINL